MLKIVYVSSVEKQVCLYVAIAIYTTAKKNIDKNNINTTY